MALSYQHHQKKITCITVTDRRIWQHHISIMSTYHQSKNSIQIINNIKKKLPGSQSQPGGTWQCYINVSSIYSNQTWITVTAREIWHYHLNIISAYHKNKKSQQKKTHLDHSHSKEEYDIFISTYQQSKKSNQIIKRNHLDHSHSQGEEGTCTGNQHTCLQRGTSWIFWIECFIKFLTLSTNLCPAGRKQNYEVILFWVLHIW